MKFPLLPVAAALIVAAFPVQASGPFESTYTPLPSEPVMIQNATILTGTGTRLDTADVLMRNGVIEAVGQDLDVPEGVQVIDGTGRWITPGIIDNHSHLGVYPSPGVEAHSDGNEITSPNTAEVWAEHSVWPQDPGFIRALEAGVTSLAVLPGSANLFGGRIATLRNVPGRGYQDMLFPGAPHGLKMACGENPKRVYGQGRSSAPMTRMGNVAGYRNAWIRAADYQRRLNEYEENVAAGEDATPPTRDLQLETLAGVLRGEILVHNHCYRADEMLVMLDVAEEFGYSISSFHHAVESYKIADRLAEAGVCSSMWADWWGFKIEAWDGIRENAAIVEASGACAIIHSDSAVGIQRLNQEAAKALAAGQRAGLPVTPEIAIQWITLNPARSLGIDDRTGSIEVGKMADLVIWDRYPFSVYARPQVVFIDGARAYDRADPERQPRTDFELGLGAIGGAP